MSNSQGCTNIKISKHIALASLKCFEPCFICCMCTFRFNVTWANLILHKIIYVIVNAINIFSWPGMPFRESLNDVHYHKSNSTSGCKACRAKHAINKWWGDLVPRDLVFLVTKLSTIPQTIQLMPAWKDSEFNANDTLYMQWKACTFNVAWY